MAKKKDKDESVEEVEDPVEEVEAPPKKGISDQEYEKLKLQARQEVLAEIQRGALAVPRAVFHKNAKSAVEPVFASKKDGLTPNEDELPAGENQLVEIQIDEPLFINGKEFYGKTIVKTHEARSIAHMIQQKKQADYESTIGRSYLAKKLANGKLDLREVQDLDAELEKHVGKK